MTLKKLVKKNDTKVEVKTELKTMCPSWSLADRGFSGTCLLTSLLSLLKRKIHTLLLTVFEIEDYYVDAHSLILNLNTRIEMN